MADYYDQYIEDCAKNIESCFNAYSMLDILNETKNSSFKGAALLDDSHLLFYNYKKQPKDKFYFHKLKQNFLSYNMAVLLPDSLMYQSTFKLKMNQLIHGVFFDYWMNKYLHHSSLVNGQKEDSKVVLTMNHLSVGFSIWLAMLLIALVTFIAEFVKFRIAKCCRKKYRNFRKSVQAQNYESQLNFVLRRIRI